MLSKIGSDCSWIWGFFWEWRECFKVEYGDGYKTEYTKSLWRWIVWYMSYVSIFFFKIAFWSSLWHSRLRNGHVTAGSLQRLRSLLWHGLEPWPWVLSHTMGTATPPPKKRKKEKLLLSQIHVTFSVKLYVICQIYLRRMLEIGMQSIFHIYTLIMYQEPEMLSVYPRIKNGDWVEQT